MHVMVHIFCYDPRKYTKYDICEKWHRFHISQNFDVIQSEVALQKQVH